MTTYETKLVKHIIPESGSDYDLEVKSPNTGKWYTFKISQNIEDIKEFCKIHPQYPFPVEIIICTKHK